MTEFNIRSDAVDVEQIMRQIRARIREKRGSDYTEDDVRQLASVKLEKFLEPTGVRSDLIDQFRRRQLDPEPPLNYGFEDDTIFASHRPSLRWIRRLLNPVLKLLFNPNPIIHALHLQSQINDGFYTRNQKREPLYFEVMHNLVLEMTKLGIEVKNLKMRVESLSSRLDFNERRARALEGVVQYKPDPTASPPDGDGSQPDGQDGAKTPRRRRRRRRSARRPDSDTSGGDNAETGKQAADGPDLTEAGENTTGPVGVSSVGDTDADQP
jgi:hypothetical protein